MNKEKYAKQDEQLYYHIRGLQAGNVQSYTEVYNLSSKYLYKIIYDIVQDYHTTEDMLQETFLKIYNNIGSLQNPEAYFVWAGRIATNLCVRYIHKYRKEVLTTVNEDGEGNEEFIFDTEAEDNEMFIPESVLDNKEHQRMIGEVIDSLSVEQKLAVQCFYFEEMSVKEIATLMECSEGTIKSRLNYARKSIKDSVLNIEKTQGTKLYSFGAIPLLLLAYRSVAQAAVPASAVAGTGAALAGMYGTGGSVAGAAVGGANMAGATVGATSGVAGMTAATAGAAAAGISGKLVAIIAATVLATGAIVGGTVWTVMEQKKEVNIDDNATEIMTNESDVDKEDVTVIEDNIDEEEISKDNNADTNINGDVIPAGGKYIVASTGEELKEGNKMPENPKKDDCYFFGDYKYIYTNGDWKVELGEIEDLHTRESFGEILNSIAGCEITNIMGLFMDCSGMVTAPAIPDAVTNMVGAFSGCKSLVEAPVLPKGVKYMADTFMNCESLIKAPEIPEGVEMMEGCFANCTSLVEAPRIPEGVTSLMETFAYCTSLETAPELPESVTDLIGTFKECTSLVEPPVIPMNAKDISYMFDGCVNLLNAPAIPYGVTNMDFTFYRCSKITEVSEIPETVINLKATFHSCESLLEAPNIPPEVTDLSYTFANCTNLLKASEIPMGVKRMEYTFGQCEKLMSAPTIPASVIDVTSTFIYCFGLTGTITIDANPMQYEEFLQGISFETQNIEVVGASTMLDKLKATSEFYESNGN